MRGNKSFISHAIKNAETAVDFENRATVQRILRTKFGIPALMDEVIFISNTTGKLEKINQKKYHSKEEIYKEYWVHSPDLLVKIFNFVLVFEIDGDVHWQNSHAVKQTNNRNYHYEKAGIKMLWLTRKEVESSTPDKLEKIILVRLSEILGFEPIRLS